MQRHVYWEAETKQELAIETLADTPFTSNSSSSNKSNSNDRITSKSGFKHVNNTSGSLAPSQYASLMHNHGNSSSNPPAIIIDNGSYDCRVGFSTDAAPRLIYPSKIVRTRTNPPIVYIGSEAPATAVAQAGHKYAHEKSVVINLQVQESLLDFAFSHLGITASSVQHPIVMTECLLNPSIARAQLSELLFECYGVPSVCFGVDSLFSKAIFSLSASSLSFSLCALSTLRACAM